jgi:hypothetical protein
MQGIQGTMDQVKVTGRSCWMRLILLENRESQGTVLCMMPWAKISLDGCTRLRFRSLN